MYIVKALEWAIIEAAERYPDDPARQIIERGANYVREAVARPQRARLMFGGQLVRRVDVPVFSRPRRPATRCSSRG